MEPEDVQLPSQLNVGKFASSRVKEILALQDIVSE